MKEIEIIAALMGAALIWVGAFGIERGHGFLGWGAIIIGATAVILGTYGLCLSLTESAPASYGASGASATTYGRAEDVRIVPTEEPRGAL